MTFIIVCGGTAGHINPGISIAQELQNRVPEAKIVFIGADRDMEKRLVPEAGFELINIKMRGVKRGKGLGAILHNVKTVINVISADIKASVILKELSPAAVIGTGGYICYPVLRAAAKRKIPTFIHESNACPGMTVRMLSGIVDKVMITYPGYDTHYKCPERLVLTGTPVRKEFTDTQQESDEADKKPIVLSFWGSLGAEKMNEIMAGFIKRNLEQESFYHIHAAGNSLARLDTALSDLGVRDIKPPYADIREYISNMPEVMKSADLVLCRAGGITLAELTAAGKPGILIPSPFVPDNVQQKNAEQLNVAGAAVIISETDCNSRLLYDKVSMLVSNKEKLREMSKAAKALSKPGAVSDIADIILGAVK